MGLEAGVLLEKLNKTCNTDWDGSGCAELALVLLFCLLGVLCVYYGTEAGLSGGAEPVCCEAFPWGGSL